MPPGDLPTARKYASRHAGLMSRADSPLLGSNEGRPYVYVSLRNPPSSRAGGAGTYYGEMGRVRQKP